MSEPENIQDFHESDKALDRVSEKPTANERVEQLLEELKDKKS